MRKKSGSRIDKAREWILEEESKALNNFAYIYFQGDPVFQDRQACFYDIGLPVKNSGKKIQWFLDWNPNRSDKYPEYVDYVINRSPMADVFADKDPERIPFEPTLFNTKHATRTIVSAAIMIRYLNEKRPLIEWWYELRKTFSEDLAFLVPHLFSRSASGVGTAFLKPYIENSQYHGFNSYFTRSRMYNWLTHNRVGDVERGWMYHNFKWNYRDLSAVFGPPGNVAVYPRQLVKSFKNSDYWDTEIIGYSEKDIVEIMTEMLTLNDVPIGNHIHA